METLDSTQLDQLKAIGAYLAQLREEQGLSIEEIATKTYVPLRLLRAIEAGQAKILPEPIFVQGFIRRYADALGLDGAKLSQQFPVEVEQPYVETKSSKEAPVVSPRMYSDAPETISPGERSPQPLALYLLLGVLVLGGLGYGISRGLQDRSTQQRPAATDVPEPPAASPTLESSPVVSPSPVAEVASPDASPLAESSPLDESSPQASPLSDPVPSPSLSPSPVTEPLSVNLNLTGDSWLRVTVDGTVQYEGILPQGTQRTWAGTESVVIRSGNAGAVSVSVNQGSPQVMGDLGQAETLTFTADNSTDAAPQ